MKFFVEYFERGIWDAITNGPLIPNIEKDKVFIEKPLFEWTESEGKKAKYNCIAKNVITFALNSNEFF